MTHSRHPAALAAALALVAASTTVAAPAAAQEYTRADSLRGSLTSPARTWWDVTFYDLHVALHPSDSTIAGYNAISYRVVEPNGKELQIDLQAPLRIDSIVQDGRRLEWRSEGAAHFVRPASPQRVGQVRTLTVHYGGSPTIAVRPPWDGGFTWTADSLGTTWIATTDQGIGASIWWPNKDTYADEPDSQRVALRVPDPLVHLGNGRLESVVPNGDGTTTWSWFVSNPINNYAINVAAGDYAHWTEYYPGERGTLTMDFYPLAYNVEKAKKQFPQAISMMRCFEHWYGPYPWYEDGYKLIEVPNTGMEHQSAVTYGNWYANGYRGRDGSGTGLGMEWDFIIVHESAHEWWANSITMQDQADMWVHESFANYSEGIYTECLFGEDAGARYIRGTRRGVRNQEPVVPSHRGVNASPPGDQYPKGGNMLHTIRQIVGDTEAWRQILRGLQSEFRHEIVTGQQVRDYISERAGTDLSKVFEQYLETTMIPVFEYEIDGSTLRYRWTNVVPGFDMPVEVTLADDRFSRITPTEAWQTAPLRLSDPSTFQVDPDYYVEARSTGE